MHCLSVGKTLLHITTACRRGQRFDMVQVLALSDFLLRLLTRTPGDNGFLRGHRMLSLKAFHKTLHNMAGCAAAGLSLSQHETTTFTPPSA